MRFAFLLYLLAAVANAELFQVQPFEQVCDAACCDVGSFGETNNS